MSHAYNQYVRISNQLIERRQSDSPLSEEEEAATVEALNRCWERMLPQEREDFERSLAKQEDP